MRIIEASEETTLPELEIDEPKDSKVKEPEVEESNSLQRDIFNIAKDIHTLGNKLIELASKL